MFGYWFNFNRGYITPVGTTKLNRRYVGIPEAEKYEPIILGLEYHGEPLPDVLKIIMGLEYAPFDFTGLFAIIGTKYSPYDYKGSTAILGALYEALDHADKARAIIGGAYDPYDHIRHRRVIIGGAYECIDPNFERRN